jgi:hypothetical protein
MEAIGALLSEAMLSALDELALEQAIPRLDWEIVRYPDGIVFEGWPRTAGQSRACEQWAAALGMSCYEFDTREGKEIWFLNDELWSLEIHCEPRP